ncbi:MAG: ribonuclease P protein component [Muribaculaceae bacterium]|nr:ribonuclease P protein component [Muribaculaceae bacterium]
MASFRLYKSEKLCSQTAIDLLFGRRQTTICANEKTTETTESGDRPGGSLAFPLRAVWRHNPGRTRGSDVQFLISIPKKRLRHAVDRVTMRRRVREAYRLNRHLLDSVPDGMHIDVAFIYVAPTLQPYASVEQSVYRLLRRMARSFTPSDNEHPE